MSCAQIGSGKTAAFLVPIINHIVGNELIAMKTPSAMSTSCRPVFPVALILSPIRELVIQTHKGALKFAYRINMLFAAVQW
uniref:ATP-dependent RNA helicase n=1 Tax=Elaeophora elaphi TaxID=1147741 RepID=A0A0R3S1M3_9BILA